MSSVELPRPPRTLPVTRADRFGGDVRIVAAALAIGFSIVVGMGLGVAPLTLAASLAAIAVALVSPPVGLALVAFMGPIAAPLVVPTPGFKALLVGALVLGCIYRLPIDRPRIRPSASLLLLAGFVLYVAVHQTPEMFAGYAGAQGYLVYSIFRELVTGFAAVLAAAYVLRGRNPVPFVAVALTSACLAAVMAFVTFGAASTGPLLAGLTVGEPGRASGYFGNPNYFGVFAAVATVAAAGCLVAARTFRLRLVLLGVAIVIGLAVVVSLSRGAAITLAAGLAVLGLTGWRPRTAIIVGGSLVAVAAFLFPLFVAWRLGITEGSASANSYALLAQSDNARRGALLAGPLLFLTSPLFGVGWGHYSARSAEFAGPGISLGSHNWYMSVLAELGAVGIVLWMLLLVTLVIALRSRPTIPRRLGFGVLGAYVVGCLFLEAPNDFQTSSLAIVMVVAAIAGRWPESLEGDRPIARSDTGRRP